jgi:hypothetical protein
MPETLQVRVEAVKQVTELFRMERMVYLSATGISLAMLITSAIVLMVRNQASNAELAALFGSSGLITYTAGRLLFMWNQAMRILAGEPLAEMPRG